MVGQSREPIWQAILPFVTCGIWIHVWMYMVTEDLRRHTNRQDLNPGLDLLLGLLTCGIYYYFAIWRNSKLLWEATHRAGLPAEDKSVLFLLLFIFFYPATLYIFQEDLNRLWARYAGAAQPPSVIG